MAASKNLTDADDLELTCVTKHRDNADDTDVTDDWDVNRWTKDDKDRLYVNAGTSKCDKYGLYVDLTTNDVPDTAAHSGSVTVGGDTAEITIVNETGLDDTTYTLHYDITWDVDVSLSDAEKIGDVTAPTTRVDPDDLDTLVGKTVAKTHNGHIEESGVVESARDSRAMGVEITLRDGSTIYPSSRDAEELYTVTENGGE